MQQLLPLALRKVLLRSVHLPLIRFCRYFKGICSKVLQSKDLLIRENEIAETLCQLERIFPPSFFDVMVHLCIHLANEARLAGPVHYRWMYPIERYLSTLKSYVRNKNHPEGSIAEGYIADECLTFCSMYFSDDVETRFNRIGRNDIDDETPREGLQIFSMLGQPIGKAEIVKLDNKELLQAHRYALFNCKDIDAYIDQHKNLVATGHPSYSERQIQRIHNESFPTWFQEHVTDMDLDNDNPLKMDLKLLARGPNVIAKKYKGFIINGFRFHTKDRKRYRSTQNSGVMVSALTSSFTSCSDRNPTVGELSYCGVINDIIEINYSRGKNIVLFDCDWVSKGKRLKQDVDGFTLTNFTNVKRHNEPFILASQAKQVFYVEDPLDSNWKVVLKSIARDHYDMVEKTENVEFEHTAMPSAYPDKELDWTRNNATVLVSSLTVMARKIAKRKRPEGTRSILSGQVERAETSIIVGQAKKRKKD